MAFYHQSHPWNPGYAIPDYVLAEPPGRGTFTTAWLPRRTISAIMPDYLAKPMQKELYGKRSYGPAASATSGLGDTRYILTPTGDDLSAPASTLPTLKTAAVVPAPSKIPGWLIPVAAIAGIMFVFRKK